MGLKQFKIYFDSPNATYYPGQTVTGKIVLELHSAKKMRGIRLIVKGEAHTFWQENEWIFKVTGHEEYFKARFYIVGSENGTEIELPGGKHAYPFNYVLPPDLPRSFESDFGRIQYTARAVLDLPLKFDPETKEEFTVISHFDLNKESSASKQVNFEGKKKFDFGFYVSSPLSLNVQLPVRGYVPGQIIPLSVSVENQSDVVVDKIKHKLVKVITYSAKLPYKAKKVEKFIVAEVSKGLISDSGRINYEQNLIVPPLPPLFVNHCNIINLGYVLIVEACISESAIYYQNLEIETKILIGTVPLSNSSISVPSVSVNQLLNSRIVSSTPCSSVQLINNLGDAANQRSEPRIPVYYAPAKLTGHHPPSYNSNFVHPPTYEESMKEYENRR